MGLRILPRGVSPKIVGEDASSAVDAINKAQAKASELIKRRKSSDDSNVVEGVIGELGGVLKGTDLAETVDQVKSMVSVLKQLGLISTSMTTAFFGLGVAADAVIGHVKKLHAEWDAADKEGFKEAKTTGDKLSKQVTRDEESGALAPEKATSLKKDIDRQNREIAELEKELEVTGLFGGGHNEAVMAKLNDKRAEQHNTQAELAKSEGPMRATIEGAEEKSAHSQDSLAQQDYALRHQLLQESLDKNLISQKAYLQEVQGLIDEETNSHLKALDVRRKHLQGELDREIRRKADVNTIGKTASELAAVQAEGERIFRDGRNAKEAERRRVEQASVFKPTPINADELARIGLFRGGGGQADIGVQQLEVLKQIVEGVRRVEVTTRNA